MRVSLKSSRYAAVALSGAIVLASALNTSGPALAGSSGKPLLIRGVVESSELEGVFCITAANCWAVGEQTINHATLNLVLHWTGRHWARVSVPNPGGIRNGDSSELFGIRCTSASNCWTVGHAQKLFHADLDEALHWNGKKWSAVPTPTPAGILSGDNNRLDDVTCTSAARCLAVGTYGTTTSSSTGNSVVALNQALRWNGKVWSLVSTPNPAGTSPNHGNALNSVRCTSATNCWAGGTYGTITAISQSTEHNQILHWNGKKWTKATVPNPEGTNAGSVNDIEGLACTAVTNCWAAGLTGHVSSDPSTTEIFNEIFHWNGKKWRNQVIPQPGGGGAGTDDALNGITCSTARNCWAVGSRSHTTAGTPTLNEALRWNGAKWSSVSTPNPGGTGMGDTSELNSARCTTAANCWAVGFSQASTGQETAERLHWTGKKWFVG